MRGSLVKYQWQRYMGSLKPMGLVWLHSFRTHHTEATAEAERTDGCHPMKHAGRGRLKSEPSKEPQ